MSLIGVYTFFKSALIGESFTTVSQQKLKFLLYYTTKTFPTYSIYIHNACISFLLSEIKKHRQKMKFSARYSLLFFCRIARFLTSQYAQRFINRAPAYYMSIDELPSRGRVGLNHSVKGVLQGSAPVRGRCQITIPAVNAYIACMERAFYTYKHS